MNAQYTTNLKYRKLDENGDMVFGHGDKDFLYGLDAMGQVIQTRLKAIRDEWWEGDPTAIPWTTDVIGARVTTFSKDRIDLMVIERLMDTVGVNSVSDIESSFVNRRYTFSCKVQTVYGETTGEVSIP